MSMHPSLKIDKFKSRTRSVRKRGERLRSLMLQQKWKKGQTIFGLPREKNIRMKMNVKEKKKALPVPTDIIQSIIDKKKEEK